MGKVEPSQKPHSPPSLKSKIFRYIWVLGFALACMEGLTPLIKLSSWVRYITRKWRDILDQIYLSINSFLNISVDLIFYDIVVSIVLYLSIHFRAMQKDGLHKRKILGRKAKTEFVAKRVVAIVGVWFTVFIFLRFPIVDAIRLPVSIIPLVALIWSIRVNKQPEEGFVFVSNDETIKVLVQVWIVIVGLIVLSQTSIIEAIAGGPPPL